MKRPIEHTIEQGLRDYRREFGLLPTSEALARWLKLPRSTVNYNLNRLVDRGRVSHDPGRHGHWKLRRTDHQNLTTGEP